MRRAQSALAGLLLLLPAGKVSAGKAGPSQGLRMAIVLDDSASMQRSDPRRLSVTAAMIAVQLADHADRVALVPLNRQATRLQRGGAPRQLLARLRSFPRRSAQTIYDAPLRRALGLLARQSGKRLILFLTDGAPDPGPRGDRARVLAAQEAYLRQLTARPPGPRVYAVLLGSLGQRWRGEFEQMALSSGARAFAVERAETLVSVFAEIYASQLGSKVVVLDLADGTQDLATVDDYVRYANVVVISRGGAFGVSYPDGRRAGPVLDNGLDPKAQPGDRVYHFVDKLRPSARGAKLRLTLGAKAGGGRYKALLIWDYDLALHLDRPRPDTGGDYPLTARLTRSSGAPVTRQPFLRGVKVTARVCRSSSGKPRCDERQRLKLACDAGGQCRYTGRFVPPGPGVYQIDAVARRVRGGKQVLEMPSRQRYTLDVPGGGKLGCGGAKLSLQLDQNQPRPWRRCQVVPLSVSGLRPGTVTRVRLADSRGGLALPRGVRLVAQGAAADGSLPVTAGRPARVNVCLEASHLVDRPGETVSGEVTFEAVNKRWFAPAGARAAVPAKVALTARSWWNRYKRLLCYLGIGLLLLLLLIWIIRGFLSPHAFPSALKVNWGKSLERLDRNEMPVSELPQARRGFYRNAQLWIGGGRCFVDSGLPACARFEATGRRSISLISDAGGTEVLRINKFDPDKRDPVGSGSLVSLGDAYLVNELYVRLKL